MVNTISILRKQSRQCPTISKLSDTHRFKDSIVTTIIGPRHKPRSSHQPCTHIAHHIPIEIRHHHHIKLLGLGHQLKHNQSRWRVNNSDLETFANITCIKVYLSPAWWCCPQSCCQMWCLGNQRQLLCNTAGTNHHQVSCRSRKATVNIYSTKKLIIWCKTQVGRQLWTHMMLALCTAVTLRRPFSLASRKA